MMSQSPTSQLTSSIFQNPWDSKLPTPIFISISDKKFYINHSSCFCYETHIKIGDNKILLDTIGYDNPLEVIPHKKYEIIFEDTHTETPRTFKLPNNMSEHLFSFLTGARRKEECCTDFINDLYFGCGMVDINTFNLLKPTMVYDENNMLIGQVIAIGDNEQDEFKIKHVAMYIGKGLFISAFGNNPLFVTTLEQMQVLYQAAKVSAITPFYKQNSYKQNSPT